jgi:hypothetical protein
MKFLLTGKMPIEEGNRLIKSGKLAGVLQAALESIKPEAVYFGLKDGQRTIYLIVEMSDASQIPSICEPLFLSFGGNIELTPLMTQQDLGKAIPGIEAAVKKFGS